MAKIVIAQQFCGPPNSGNGGYVCGVLAKDLEGPVTSVLRARVPLDVDLDLAVADGAAVMTDAAGGLIGRGDPAAAGLLPEPPAAPGVDAARAAGARYLGLRPAHSPDLFHLRAGAGRGRWPAGVPRPDRRRAGRPRGLPLDA